MDFILLRPAVCMGSSLVTWLATVKWALRQIHVVILLGQLSENKQAYSKADADIRKKLFTDGELRLLVDTVRFTW